MNTQGEGHAQKLRRVGSRQLQIHEDHEEMPVNNSIFLSASLVASCAAGSCELVFFHPTDTIIKRLMANTGRLTGNNWQNVAFQDSAHLSIPSRIRSLFPGLGYGAAYKLAQRMYVFGLQPFAREAVNSISGDRFGKPLSSALGGSVVGIGEVVLLPLNVLKIKVQTNAMYRGRSLLSILQQEGLRNLWAGWQWTVARNAVGSFGLFGASSFVKEYVYSLTDHRDATFFQMTMSSFAGAVSSIVVACPFDAVKTRIQSGLYGQCGWTIARNLKELEGFQAFFKGCTLKVFAVGPKLIFSFTVVQYLTAFLEKSWKKHV